MDTPYVRSRVRTRTHGSVGRRGLRPPSDPMNDAFYHKLLGAHAVAVLQELGDAEAEVAALAASAVHNGEHRGGAR